jgi:hypothetical protein
MPTGSFFWTLKLEPVYESKWTLRAKEPRRHLSLGLETGAQWRLG